MLVVDEVAMVEAGDGVSHGQARGSKLGGPGTGPALIKR